MGGFSVGIRHPALIRLLKCISSIEDFIFEHSREGGGRIGKMGKMKGKKSDSRITVSNLTKIYIYLSFNQIFYLSF